MAEEKKAGDEATAGVEELTTEKVKHAKKAELVEMCKARNLDSEGKVSDLRQRLLDHLAEEERLEEEGEVEVVEEGEYVAKLHPDLSDSVKRALELRRLKSLERPRFLRQEWYRYKRLGMKWRKPRGEHSKLRRYLKYRINNPSTGFRGPKVARGLHPSGFREVLVHNPRDLEGVNPKTQAVRIAHGVGWRKRTEIQKSADEKGIRILNRMVEE